MTQLIRSRPGPGWGNPPCRHPQFHCLWRTTYPSMQRSRSNPDPRAGLQLPACSAAARRERGGRCGALHAGSCSPAGRWSGAAPPSRCRPASVPRPAPRSSPRRRRLSLGRRKPRRERGSRGGRSGAMGDSKVKVAVRVRPMNRRGESLLLQRPAARPARGGSGPEGGGSRRRPSGLCVEA